ncbi:MAG TPA: hypothetical protein VKA70_06105 [Blastocatellia bacterium]|nr:hypothetical protein [Blastocatellia bacterium]
MRPMNQFDRRERAPGGGQMRDLPATRVIPYEYVAEFKLNGEVGRLVQDVINISVEGVFVASSIGYGFESGFGFEEERRESFDLINLAPGASPSLGEIKLSNIPPDFLIEGFRINPEFESIAIRGGALNSDLPFDVAKGLFQRLGHAENFSFLFSIVDTASGRELQNEPVHSLATLGGIDGRRPFKMLPQPVTLQPRSTIRLQVEERTKGVKGTLFIALHGYKILGMAGAVEEEVRRLGEYNHRQKIPIYDHETGNYRTLGEAVERNIPTNRVVPFDYVSTLDLEGRRGNIAEDEVPVNVDGGYVATAIGYSLDGGDTEVGVDAEVQKGFVDLSQVKLKDLKPAEALLDGIRIHPVRARFAFDREGRLTSVDKDLTGRMFQRLNRSEDVRFLYKISDSGTGRDLQNQKVHNIAGLGTASGDRPFKVLHKPMMFLPRSTIQIQVEEITGRGRLFIVFQGYKILS